MKLAWTQDRIDIVASLLREGLSARQIGNIMNTSNGSIVGIVHRTPRLADIGFARPAPVMKTREQVERDRIEERLRHQGNGEIIIGLATVRKEKTLMELTSFQCKFPIWKHDERPTEFLFCAEAVVQDSSYCAVHKKLCRAQAHSYQPRQKEQQP